MTTVRCKLPQRSGGGAEPQPTVTRAARMLALAHHIDRLVEDGEIASVAEAARQLGMTRARMTQIMNLLLLSPVIQERLLSGEALSERSLRRVVAEPAWKGQTAAVAATPR